jgi:hypothetical protein
VTIDARQSWAVWRPLLPRGPVRPVSVCRAPQPSGSGARAFTGAAGCLPIAQHSTRPATNPLTWTPCRASSTTAATAAFDLQWILHHRQRPSSAATGCSRRPPPIVSGARPYRSSSAARSLKPNFRCSKRSFLGKEF